MTKLKQYLGIALIGGVLEATLFHYGYGKLEQIKYEQEKKQEYEREIAMHNQRRVWNLKMSLDKLSDSFGNGDSIVTEEEKAKLILKLYKESGCEQKEGPRLIHINKPIHLSFLDYNSDSCLVYIRETNSYGEQDDLGSDNVIYFNSLEGLEDLIQENMVKNEKR